MWRDIFITITQLIVAPQKEWKNIEKGNRAHSEFLKQFLHPVFGIIALTSFIGGLWVKHEGNLESALKQSITCLVAVYGGYFIASYILNELSPRFGLEKNLPRFQQFVGYSSVVLYLLYIITPFFPDFIISWLLVFYTFHVVNTGAHNFVKVDEDNRVSFILVASALVILSPGAIHFLFSISIK